MLMIVGSLLIVAVSKSMSHNDPIARNESDDLYLTAMDETDEIIAPIAEVTEHTILQILFPFFIAFTTCLVLTVGSYLSRVAKS